MNYGLEYIYYSFVGCRMDSLLMGNSTTADSCPLSGSAGSEWWKYLVTSIVIYIVGLSLCLIARGIYWLVVKKFELIHIDEEKIVKGNKRRKSCFNFIRSLLAGNSHLSKILIISALVCNVIYMILGILRTYSYPSIESCFDTNKTLNSIFIERPEMIVEVIITIVLIIFALIRFLASKNIILFWINVYTLVDVFTLPHIFVSLAIGKDWVGLRSLRFIWLTQFTTVLRFIPFIHSQDTVDLIGLLIYFLIVWLMSAGIIHLLENMNHFHWFPPEKGKNAYLVYAYFIMVTLSTVGYGDILPTTVLGRTFMTFFIVGGLAFFASLLPKIAEVLTNYRAKHEYASFDTALVPRHIIVCGHITAVTADDFLKDFLHEDRGDTKTHVLFLHNMRPDQELKNVLRSNYTRVQYIMGSILNGKDLQRAKIMSAEAVFILANKFADNPSEEDNANLLRVASVKNTTTTIRLIVQLLLSFSKKQVYNIEGWNIGQDIALSLNELKLGLLAQSCMCPGFSTLIANLFYTADFPNPSSFTGDQEWKKYYTQGASNEIYPCSFSEAFDGLTFHEASRKCYNDLQLLLLAVERITPTYHKYYVNPSPSLHSTLRIDSKSMWGYFIARDKKHVKTVSSYCNCCPNNQHVTSKADVIGGRKPRLNYRSRRYINPNEDFSMSSITDSSTKAIINIEDMDGDKQSMDSETKLNRYTKKKQGHGALLDVQPAANVTDIRRGSTNKLSLLDNDSDSEDEAGEGRKFQMYVCEPHKLESSILNPDVLSVESSHLRPKGNVTDHIVLCLFADGNSPLLGLHNFLKPLRSKNLPQDKIMPVVIVSNKAFIEKEWPIIRNIPEIYLVVGSPLRWSNVKAANVMSCKVCVVLTVVSNVFSREHAMSDKEAILCSLSIKNKLKKCDKNVHIITDLRYESNVQFLDFGDEDEPDERIYKAQPFACGEAFSFSMFDSVTSSAFHGPGTLYLIEELIHASGTKSKCKLELVPVSKTNHTGKTFKEFYNDQLLKCKVCPGISRILYSSNNPFQRYTITCPDHEMILEEGDLAYILTE